MRRIEKKILSEFFDAIVAGKKKYELRLNEFEAAEGDVLFLREWNPERQEYTGREVEKIVTYARIFKLNELYWPKGEIEEKGLLVMSIE